MHVAPQPDDPIGSTGEVGSRLLLAALEREASVTGTVSSMSVSAYLELNSHWGPEQPLSMPHSSSCVHTAKPQGNGEYFVDEAGSKSGSVWEWKSGQGL